MTSKTWVTRAGREVEVGVGWWPGSPKLFTCGRTYYDGWWYGFRLGPFFLAVAPFARWRP